MPYLKPDNSHAQQQHETSIGRFNLGSRSKQRNCNITSWCSSSRSPSLSKSLWREMEAYNPGLSTFLAAATSTFSRFFPRIKQRYDYGAMIFILTFSLVSVSGYREDKVIEITYERLTTIITAGVVCVILSIFICPVWAGEDLHNMVTQNLEMIASFLEGFGGEYFRSPEDGDSHVISEGKKPFPMEYRSVLNSNATEQSLVSIEPLPLTEICVL
ncbi:hypothetical protein NE237_033182 [Protea cynaroides]|uniref:Aluminum-activated malate transporter n=1 Tax=Protea cynaroides TaxID=273540 RepID=A0A9Q0R3T4_9MAGN|nr:hypothetical protein NE237_033182 [Protea cynaroides]